jgi:hypothetical protein
VETRAHGKRTHKTRNLAVQAMYTYTHKTCLLHPAGNGKLVQGFLGLLRVFFVLFAQNPELRERHNSHCQGNLNIKGHALKFAQARGCACVPSLSTVNCFKPETRLNDSQKYSRCPQQNTALLCYKHRLIPFKEIIAVYSENHTKPTNTLCGQNVMLLNVKAGGTYSYH